MREASRLVGLLLRVTPRCNHYSSSFVHQAALFRPRPRPRRPAIITIRYKSGRVRLLIRVGSCIGAKIEIDSGKFLWNGRFWLFEVDLAIVAHPIKECNNYKQIADQE